MKVLFSISAALTIMVSFSAYSQQSEPLFTQYMFNQLYFNAATAGSSEGLAVKTIFRTQWVGIDRNPVTGVFSADLPVEALHGGIGIVASLNRIGFERNSFVKLAYAYRKPLSNGVLSIGTDVGLVNRSSDSPNGFITPDPNNPGLTSSQLKPDLGLGVHYQTERFHFGASSLHLTEPQYDFGSELTRHFFVTSGINVFVLSGVVFQPSFLFRTDQVDSNFDLNVNTLLLNVFTVGATFRSDDAMAFILGYQLGDYFRFSYSYDLSTTNTRQNNDGSHELVLRYLLKKS